MEEKKTEKKNRKKGRGEEMSSRRRIRQRGKGLEEETKEIGGEQTLGKDQGHEVRKVEKKVKKKIDLWDKE